MPITSGMVWPGLLYWLGLRDSEGCYLDGSKAYTLTVPLPGPGKLFWSVTVYDSSCTTDEALRAGRPRLRRAGLVSRPGAQRVKPLQGLGHALDPDLAVVHPGTLFLRGS